MKITYQCLESFVTLKINDNELPNILSKIGLEVETTSDYYNTFDHKKIIKINITPNRGDCLSIYGIARDLYARGIATPTKKFLDFLNLKIGFFNNHKIQTILSNRKDCQEIVFIKMVDVNNALPIDNNILTYLQSMSIATQTNILSISRYTMYEFGRPTCIYDADKIKGKIVVRSSNAGEHFIAIDCKNYILPKGILVIADEEKILSIAGILEGATCKVNQDTKKIIIEIADFCPVQILRSAQLLNVHTDFSYRFERRIDHGITRQFIAYLTQLITQKCGGMIKAINYLRGDSKNYSKKININFSKINKLYGIKIDIKYAQNILTKLGFVFDKLKTIIQIPIWRQGDIVEHSDIAEEIIRMFDLQDIHFNDSTHPQSNSDIASTLIKRLINRHYYEQITWSFVRGNIAQLFVNSIKHVLLKNPLNSDLTVMRPSLLPGLIEVAQKNMNRSIFNLLLMEYGKIYHKIDNKITETSMITAIKIGDATTKSIHQEQRKYDFFDMKDDFLAIIDELAIDMQNLEFTNCTQQYYHYEKSAAIYCRQNLIGYAGSLHPKILKIIKFTHPIYVLEFFVNNIPRKYKEKIKQTLFSLQKIKRDLSFLIKKNVTYAEVRQCINNFNINVIEKIEVFDIFQDNKTQNKEYITFSIHIQPQINNITESEIKKICQLVINRIYSHLQGELRYI